VDSCFACGGLHLDVATVAAPHAWDRWCSRTAQFGDHIIEPFQRGIKAIVCIPQRIKVVGLHADQRLRVRVVVE
jgi:hypothetical protein